MEGRNYYKATEKLLYSLGLLKKRKKRIEIEIIKLKEEYKSTFERIKDYDLSVASMDGMPSGTSTESPIENMIIKKEFYEEKLSKIDIELIMKKDMLEDETRKIDNIEAALDELDIRERDVIIRYYVSGESIREIGKKMNLAQSPVFKMKRAAIKTLSLSLFGYDALEEDIKGLISKR